MLCLTLQFLFSLTKKGIKKVKSKRHFQVFVLSHKLNHQLPRNLKFAPFAHWLPAFLTIIIGSKNIIQAKTPVSFPKQASLKIIGNKLFFYLNHFERYIDDCLIIFTSLQHILIILFVMPVNNYLAVTTFLNRF